MRPQLFAGEYALVLSRAGDFHLASMRPQLFAGEYGEWGRIQRAKARMLQ